MGITAKIHHIDTSSGFPVLFLVISVGTENASAERFGAMVKDLIDKVNKGEIKKDTPCIIWRACLLQRHTLKFRHILKNKSNEFLTEEQAVSLSIYMGEQWELECKASLDELAKVFETFKIIRLSGGKPDNNRSIEVRQNIEVIKTNGVMTIPGTSLELPKYEVKATPYFAERLKQFNANLENNEALKLSRNLAVDQYHTSFISSMDISTLDNPYFFLTQARTNYIKEQSSNYIAEDVLSLDSTIEDLQEIFGTRLRREIVINFIYPSFPSNNADKSFTVKVLKQIMQESILKILRFSDVHINITSSKDGKKTLARKIDNTHLIMKADPEAASVAQLTIERQARRLARQQKLIQQQQTAPLNNPKNTGAALKKNFAETTAERQVDPEHKRPADKSPDKSPPSTPVGSPPKAEVLSVEPAEAVIAPPSPPSHALKALRTSTELTRNKRVVVTPSATESNKIGIEGIAKSDSDEERSRSPSPPGSPLGEQASNFGIFKNNPHNRQQRTQKILEIAGALAEKSLDAEEVLRSTFVHMKPADLENLALAYILQREYIQNARSTTTSDTNPKPTTPMMN